MPKQIRTPDVTFLHLSQGDNFEQFMRGFLQYLQSKLKVIEVKGKIDYQYYECGFYHGRPDQYWQRFKNLYGMPSQQRQKPLEKEDAEKILKIYLDMSRNPNLKTGKIKETNSTF